MKQTLKVTMCHPFLKAIVMTVFVMVASQWWVGKANAEIQCKFNVESYEILSAVSFELNATAKCKAKNMPVNGDLTGLNVSQVEFGLRQGDVRLLHREWEEEIEVEVEVETERGVTTTTTTTTGSPGCVVDAVLNQITCAEPNEMFPAVTETIVLTFTPGRNEFDITTNVVVSVEGTGFMLPFAEVGKLEMEITKGEVNIDTLAPAHYLHADVSPFKVKMEVK